MHLRFSRKVLTIVIAGLAFAPGSARADYQLAAGDVIEFSAAGVSDLKQRSRVDLNGEISLPLIGQLKAAGRTLDDLRAEVRALIPTKSLRRKTPQGVDIVVVDPEEITIEIAEYRPIYVSGDVAQPGEQAFRLGMTVREAVTLSGGYDLLRFRIDRNPVMQTADLRTEYQALWTDFAQAQAQIWRVEAQLRNEPELPNTREELRQLPIPSAVVEQILRYETDALATNRSSYEREKTSLTRRMQQSEEQSNLVAEQLAKTREGVQLALEALARVQNLSEKGMTPITRVTEERRLTLLTQTQYLQTTERLGQVRKDREEIARQIEKLEEQHKAGLSKELQEATIKFAAAKTKLQAVEEKLTVIGLLKSQLTRGKGASPDIVIFRKTGSGSERIAADEDTEMRPGDTVEVSLRSQPGLAAAER